MYAEASYLGQKSAASAMAEAIRGPEVFPACAPENGALDAIAARLSGLANLLESTNESQTFTRDRLLGSPPETKSPFPNAPAADGLIGQLNNIIDRLEAEVRRASDLVGPFARL